MTEEEFEVIRKIQQGHRDEYRLLVLRYQSAIFNLMFNMLQKHEDAVELTQDVFVKAYENLNSFNFRHRFFSWIYRIAINTAISNKRMQKHRVGLENLELPSTESAEGSRITKEREIMLHHAVSQLNKKLKPVIVLKYFEQLSYTEIANLLGIKEKKVKSRLFDARKVLKKTLEQSNYFS